MKNENKQDKYTIDPGYSNLSEESENNLWLKMIFEQKNQKTHKSYIIYA